MSGRLHRLTAMDQLAGEFWEQKIKKIIRERERRPISGHQQIGGLCSLRSCFVYGTGRPILESLNRVCRTTRKQHTTPIRLVSHSIRPASIDRAASGRCLSFPDFFSKNSTQGQCRVTRNTTRRRAPSLGSRRRPATMTTNVWAETEPSTDDRPCMDVDTD